MKKITNANHKPKLMKIRGYLLLVFILSFFFTNAQDIVYSFDTDTEDWINIGGTTVVTQSEGNLSVAGDIGNFGGTRLNAQIDLVGSEYTTVELEIKNSTDINTFQLLSFLSGGSNMGSAGKTDFDVTNDGEFQTITVDIPASPNSDGKITRLGIRSKGDPASGESFLINKLTIKSVEAVEYTYDAFVENPNFDDVNGTLGNWSMIGSGGSFAVSSDANSGSQAAEFTFDAAITASVPTLFNNYRGTIDPAVDNTESVTITWDMKYTTTDPSVDVDTQVAPRWRMNKASGGGDRITYGSYKTATKDWATYTVTRTLSNTADEDYDNIELGLNPKLGDAGVTLLIDNITTSITNTTYDGRITFTGTTDTDWNTAANWSENSVPTAEDIVAIEDVANAPVISGTTGVTIKNLIISGSDGLTIDSGGSLIVTGTSDGKINYNRSLPTSNWYLVSSPVEGETIQNLISNNSFEVGGGDKIGLSSYDTSTDNWSYSLSSSTGTISSGSGYSVNLSEAIEDVSYNFNGDLEGWTSSGAGTLSVSATELNLDGDIGGFTQILSPALSLNANEFNQLELVVSNTTNISNGLRIVNYETGNSASADGGLTNFTLNTDGAEQTILIDIPATPAANSGVITQLGIQFRGNPAAGEYIKLNSVTIKASPQSSYDNGFGQNPNFDDVSGTLGNWSMTGSGGTFAVNTTGGVSGSQAAEFTFDAAIPSGFPTLYNNYRSPVTPVLNSSENVTVSWDMKYTDNPTNEQVQVAPRWRMNMASGGTGDRTGYGENRDATDSWASYTMTAPISNFEGETYDDIELGMSVKLGATGVKVLIDNITTTFSSASGRSSSPGNISFSGTMKTDDTSISLNMSGNGYNLIGNPYPSYINSGNILSNSTAALTEQTLWIWNEANDSYDTKVTVDEFIISPGQGFFVKSNGTEGNVLIAESDQSHESTDTFQKTGSKAEVYLRLSDDSNNKEAKLYYIEGANTSFDNGYDGAIFGAVENKFSIYTHLVSDSDGRDYAIQSLPDNNYENMVIPIGVNAVSGTEINISATTKNFPSEINIYIEDKEDNSFTLLDGSSSLTRNLSTDLKGIGRFYLHTTSSVLNTGKVALNNNISIYTSSRENLRIVGVQNGTTKVRLYNVLGKQLLNTSFEGNGVNNIALPNFNRGAYIVQLETESGIVNKKIILE